MIKIKIVKPAGYRSRLAPDACTLPSPPHPPPGRLGNPSFLFSRFFLEKKEKGKKENPFRYRYR